MINIIATKNNGGNDFNCIIMGDKEIPKNKISKWKIKINTNISKIYYDIYIRIGQIIIKVIYIKVVGVLFAAIL